LMKVGVYEALQEIKYQLSYAMFRYKNKH